MADYRNRAWDSGTSAWVVWTSTNAPDPTFTSAPTPSGTYSDHTIVEVIGTGTSTPNTPDVTDGTILDYWISTSGVATSGSNLTSWTGAANSVVITPSGTVTVDSGAGNEFGGSQFIKKSGSGAAGTLTGPISPNFTVSSRPYIAFYGLLPADGNGTIGAVMGFEEAFQWNRDGSDEVHLENLQNDGTTLDAEALPWTPVLGRLGFFELLKIGQYVVAHFNGVAFARLRTVDDQWNAAISQFVFGNNITGSAGDNESDVWIGGIIVSGTRPSDTSRDAFRAYFHDHFGTAAPDLSNTPSSLDSSISEYFVGNSETMHGQWEENENGTVLDLWVGSYRGFTIAARRGLTFPGVKVSYPGEFMGMPVMKLGDPDNTDTLTLGVDFAQSDVSPAHPSNYAVTCDAYCAAYGRMVPTSFAGDLNIFGLRAGFMLYRNANTSVGISRNMTGVTIYNQTTAMLSEYQTKPGFWEWVYDNASGTAKLFFNRVEILSHTGTPGEDFDGSPGGTGINGFRASNGTNLNNNGEMLVYGLIVSETTPSDVNRDAFMEFFELSMMPY